MSVSRSIAPGTHRRRDASVRWTPIALAAACTTPALAHEGEAIGAGLASGLVHPISGLDHVVAMVAVGVWGAQLGRPAIWVLPVVFPLLMAIGGFLGLVGIDLPAVEVGIAVSAIVLGLMVLLEAEPPLPVAIVLVGVFAIFHGHAHGTELPDSESAIAYSIGFVVATGLLHLVGIGIGALHHWKRARPVLRALGGGAMLAGAWFLWSALA